MSSSLSTRIDHLVFAAPSLEEAIQHWEDQLGIRAVYGGRHTQRGTHNALLSLGDRCYLELLAPDPQSTVAPPRWMGIDELTTPRFTRWAIHSASIQQEAQILSAYKAELGIVEPGERQRADGNWLRWQLTCPLPSPEVEVIPFLIDWGDSPHPSAQVPRVSKNFKIEIYHPQPAQIQAVYDQLGSEVKVRAAARAAIEVNFT